jgi:D-apiose dehydrogenase
VSGEDTATVMLRHNSGAVSIVECTHESRRLPDLFPETLIEIEGPKGAIALRPGSILEAAIDGKLRKEDVDPSVLPWAERPWHIDQESVLATCSHMLEALKSGRPADTSAADNLRTFALAEAAYVAAKSGTR